MWEIFSVWAGSLGHWVCIKKHFVFEWEKHTYTHTGILSVSHLCANTLMFHHFLHKWSKEPEPVRCDKKRTSIWLSQKAPSECNSLLHQHEMHCCDKRGSWIQTTRAHLWEVYFFLPFCPLVNHLLPIHTHTWTCKDSRDLCLKSPQSTHEPTHLPLIRLRFSLVWPLVPVLVWLNIFAGWLGCLILLHKCNEFK